MQLIGSFNSLLASTILAIAVTSSVNAVPTNPNAGMVTLPLRRVEQRSDLHPQLQLQQRMNRAHKRYAIMTGREVPSNEELGVNLLKRMYLTGSGPGSRKGGKKAKGKGKQAAKAGAAAGAATGIVAIDGKDQFGATGGANTLAAAAAAGGSGTDDDALHKAGKPTAGDSIGLDIEGDDTGYIATVQIGTPPRDFHILMDSGSADFWVGAEGCQSEAGGGCGNHNFLGVQSSTSFLNSNAQFQVSYGSGEVTGTLCKDDVTLAGLKLPQHIFGTALLESVQFSADTTAFDGLMGLAKSALSQQQQPTPPEALAAAGQIKDAITSFKISRLEDNKNDGEITFGGLDPTKFDANTLVTFKNVNPQGFWEGAMDSVTVSGKDTGLKGRTAILDTGTTLIIAPPADAAAVHKLIPGAKSDGQGGFTVPCNTQASVALSFAGKSFAIDPRDIATQPLSTDPNGDCLSGISSGQIGAATEWLVGDVFLKNAYFSVDVNKNQISLAKLK